MPPRVCLIVTVDIIGASGKILEVEQHFLSSKISRWKASGHSMAIKTKRNLAICIASGCFLLSGASESAGQQRYQPNSPTVSPYLNLFQNRKGLSNRAVPNYYSLVRPQLQQQRENHTQQTLIQQQDNTIQQLQANVQTLQERQDGPAVVTGHGSWFLNTSGYYANAGTAGPQAGHMQGQTHWAPGRGARR
jgi:hypothetical protein